MDSPRLSCGITRSIRKAGSRTSSMSAPDAPVGRNAVHFPLLSLIHISRRGGGRHGRKISGGLSAPDRYERLNQRQDVVGRLECA